MNSDLLLKLVSEGFGFIVLAIVLVMSWRRRNGKSGPHQIVQEQPSSPTLWYLQLSALSQDLRRLSQELGEHEEHAQARHKELIRSQGDLVRSIEGYRRDLHRRKEA